MVLKRSTTIAALLLFSCIAPALPAAGQTPAASEAARIDEGRRLLSQGNTARAAELGKTLLAQFPKSPAVLEFVVDADVARSGAQAGLATYDRWVAANAIDVPRALHQIARQVLRDSAGPQADPAARLKALKALADDGDVDAAAALSGDEQAVAAGLAPAMSEQAITTLLGQLQGPTTSERRRAVLALANSRSRRAVNPLIALLADPNQDIRAVAAEALGKLGATQAILPLKGLLADPVFPVQYQAAAALFALNDPSSLTWLRNLESSQEPGIRLAAAQATRSRPDGSWLALVRELTTVADSDIRRQAAELLAPHDPEAAKAVLQPLLSDANVVERELASTTLIEHAETDLASLRRYLSAGNPASRLAAASRLLQLTR